MKIYMPSRGRAGKIKTPLPVHFADDFALVVHHSELKEYRNEYPEYAVIPHFKKNIGAIRQWLFNQAQPNIDPVVMMIDDDLNLYQRNHRTRKLERTQDLDNILYAIQKHFKTYPQVGIGMRAFNNAQPDFRIGHYCISFWGVDVRILRNHNITIPPAFNVQEDLFITLSLGALGYPNLVRHDFAQSGEIRYGGCFEYRTRADMELTDALLLKQFPQFVVPDKRKASKGKKAITIKWRNLPKV